MRSSPLPDDPLTSEIIDNFGQSMHLAAQDVNTLSVSGFTVCVCVWIRQREILQTEINPAVPFIVLVKSVKSLFSLPVHNYMCLHRASQQMFTKQNV